MIQKGLPIAGLLAYALVAQCRNYRPHYRQEGSLRRAGLPIPLYEERPHPPAYSAAEWDREWLPDRWKRAAAVTTEVAGSTWSDRRFAYERQKGW